MSPDLLLIDATGWKTQWICTLIVLAYMVSVSMLRHRRAADLQKKYNLTTRASFRTMSTDDAQTILKDLTELEFPKMFGFSIIFALFKGGSPLSLILAQAAKAWMLLTIITDLLTADVWNTERVIPSCCHRATCLSRKCIEAYCRHWCTAA